MRFSDYSEKERSTMIMNLWNNYPFLNRISLVMDEIETNTRLELFEGSAAVQDYAKPLLQHSNCDPSIRLCALSDEVAKTCALNKAVQEDLLLLQNAIYLSVKDLGIIDKNSGKFKKISLTEQNLIVNHFFLGTSYRQSLDNGHASHIKDLYRIFDKASRIADIPLSLPLKTMSFSDFYNYRWNPNGVDRETGVCFQISYNGVDYDLFRM